MEYAILLHSGSVGLMTGAVITNPTCWTALKCMPLAEQFWRLLNSDRRSKPNTVLLAIQSATSHIFRIIYSASYDNCSVDTPVRKCWHRLVLEPVGPIAEMVISFSMVTLLISTVLWISSETCLLVIVQYWQRWCAERLLHVGLHSVPAQECQPCSCYVRSTSCGKASSCCHDTVMPKLFVWHIVSIIPL